MTTDEMIRNLENVAEKHKNDIVFTGQTNISVMCNDVIRKIKELQEEINKSYNKGWNDCARDVANNHIIHYMIEEE